MVSSRVRMRAITSGASHGSLRALLLPGIPHLGRRRRWRGAGASSFEGGVGDDSRSSSSRRSRLTATPARLRWAVPSARIARELAPACGSVGALTRVHHSHWRRRRRGTDPVGMIITSVVPDVIAWSPSRVLQYGQWSAMTTNSSRGRRHPGQSGADSRQSSANIRAPGCPRQADGQRDCPWSSSSLVVACPRASQPCIIGRRAASISSSGISVSRSNCSATGVWAINAIIAAANV